MTKVDAEGRFTVKRDSLRAKLLLTMSDDRANPSALSDLIRAAWPTKSTHVSVELTHLCSIGVVDRVGRGLYVRLVGEVREFRQ